MPVIKSIDLVGVSETSWEDGAKQALAEASKTIRNIIDMEVLRFTAQVSEGRIVEHHTHLRINFRLDAR